MTHIRDYDTAVTLIADADYITQGRLLGHDDDDQAGPSATTSYSDEERLKIEQGQCVQSSPRLTLTPRSLAIVARQFLDATQSQLTYHGLFQLASTLEPGSLVALFRNAHLSVVYKSPGSDTAHPKETQDAALYALVTDDVFLHEPTIVWERLEDVDGGWSTFVDSDFTPAVPVGGDVAGQTAEGALARFEMEAGLCGIVDPAEYVLDVSLRDLLRSSVVRRWRDSYRPRKTNMHARRINDVNRRSNDDVSKRRRPRTNADSGTSGARARRTRIVWSCSAHTRGRFLQKKNETWLS